MSATSRYSPDSISKVLTQSSHGFSAGDVLKRSSGSYAKAQADSEANAQVVGIVARSIDGNTFEMVEDGHISGLTGLTDATVYYLSSATPGAITSSEPSIPVVVLIADSTTSGYVISQKRGYSGFSGISGYSGTNGATGTSGYSGFDGISGYSGYSGISGYSGVGTSGFSGYSGYSGEAGGGIIAGALYLYEKCGGF